MKLGEIAHTRTGDKGNLCNICVVPYNDEDYPLLKEKVTAARVREFYKDICCGEVERYEVCLLYTSIYIIVYLNNEY